MPTVRTPEAPCRRSPSRDPRCCLPLWEMGSATPTTIDFGAIFPFTLRSGLQFPCLRFATAVTGRHARLGTRLLARLCRGCHFRRLCLTSFQGATPTDPDVRVLPHPAPRQTASLRAVAYPLVQEARRWPPPSLRRVWPVRLSGVVTWRRDPPSVCWPSFPPPVPPAGAPFPPRGRVGSIPPLRRYSETRRLLAAHPPALRCLRPAVPSEHLRFAPSEARCDVHGLGLGEPVPAPRRSLRWRRRGLPGSRETHPHACHALREADGAATVVLQARIFCSESLEFCFQGVVHYGGLLYSSHRTRRYV